MSLSVQASEYLLDKALFATDAIDHKAAIMQAQVSNDPALKAPSPKSGE